MLYFLNPTLPTRVQLSNSRVRIGRAAALEISLPNDPLISSYHCVIVDGILVDSKSTNGTIINNHKIEYGKQYELKFGDKVKIGDQVFEVAELNENEMNSTSSASITSSDDNSNSLSSSESLTATVSSSDSFRSADDEMRKDFSSIKQERKTLGADDEEELDEDENAAAAAEDDEDEDEEEEDDEDGDDDLVEDPTENFTSYSLLNQTRMNNDDNLNKTMNINNITPTTNNNISSSSSSSTVPLQSSSSSLSSPSPEEYSQSLRHQLQKLQFHQLSIQKQLNSLKSRDNLLSIKNKINKFSIQLQSLEYQIQWGNNEKLKEIKKIQYKKYSTLKYSTINNNNHNKNNNNNNNNKNSLNNKNTTTTNNNNNNNMSGFSDKNNEISLMELDSLSDYQLKCNELDKEINEFQLEINKIENSIQLKKNSIEENEKLKNSSLLLLESNLTIWENRELKLNEFNNNNNNNNNSNNNNNIKTDWKILWNKFIIQWNNNMNQSNNNINSLNESKESELLLELKNLENSVQLIRLDIENIWKNNNNNSMNAKSIATNTSAAAAGTSDDYTWINEFIQYIRLNEESLKNSNSSSSASSNFSQSMEKIRQWRDQLKSIRILKEELKLKQQLSNNNNISNNNNHNNNKSSSSNLISIIKTIPIVIAAIAVGISIGKHFL